MKMKTKLFMKRAIPILVIYVTSYAILSAQGRYVPRLTDQNGVVEQYVWAPRGFVSRGAGTNWRHLLVYGFLPAFWIDQHFIHYSDLADDGKHPINTTLEEAIKKEIKQNQAIQETP